MKKIISSLCILMLCAASFAADLSIDWSINNYAQPTGVDVNASEFDAVSGELLVANYGTDISIERYNADTGAFITSQALTPAVGSPALVDLSGFSIGAAANGNLYLSDYVPASPLWKTDSLTNGTITNVASSGNAFPLSRNMSVAGSGADTYIAVTGTADNGPISIWKADDAGATSFTPWKSITGSTLTPIGAAKAGCAISLGDSGGTIPEWVAGADVLGDIHTLRMFKYNSGTDSYDMVKEVGDSTTNYRCFDVDFDFTATDTYYPILAVLRVEPSTATPNLPAVDVWKIVTASNELVLAGSITLTGMNNIFDRGSLAIDEATQKIYVTYRGSATNNLCAARISYTRDDLPTSSEPSWALYE